MTYTRATMNILLSVSNALYAYFSQRVFQNFQTKMAWKLISYMKLSSLYQSWYSSEYDKALKSFLSELWLQGIKGPVGREESSP